MALTQPSYEFDGSGPTNWTQALTSNIPQLMDGIVELGKYAKPTLDIMWQNKSYVSVNTDGTFHFDISYGGHDVYYGDTGLTNFGGEAGSGGTGFTSGTTADSAVGEHLTRLTVKPTVMYSKMWITDFDRKKYQYGLHDLVEDKTFRMNHGLTEALNYEIWAKQGSDDSTADASQTGAVKSLGGYYGTNITDTQLTLPGAASATAGWSMAKDRLNSLPFLIRPADVSEDIGTSAGASYHKLHGLSSSEKSWRSHVYVACGTGRGTAWADGEPKTLPAFIELDVEGTGTGGGGDADDTAIGAQGWVASVTETDSHCHILKTDSVASAAAPEAGGPVNPTLSDIDFMLEKMQVGNSLEIMIACSPAAYNYIARDFFGATLGQSGSAAATGVRTMGGPLNDYGIHFSGGFRHSGYDAIFYADPSMAEDWKHSLWFWDLDALVWACVEDFGPKLYPWQRVPNSTVDAMAKVMWCQRVNRNPNATGVLLNCKFR